MSDPTANLRHGFGKRRSLHHVTITNGDRSRTFSFRPWVLGSVAACVGVFAVGYLSATAYLVWRDDILAARDTERSQIEASYESRIAYLRAEIDRLASTQVFERRSVETMVDALIERQNQLTDNHARVRALLEKASTVGLTVTQALPLPAEKPSLPGSVLSFAPAGQSNLAIGGEPVPLPAGPLPSLGLRGSSSDIGVPQTEDLGAAPGPQADSGDLLGIGATLDQMLAENDRALDALAGTAEQGIRTLTAAIRPLGLDLSSLAEEGIGGPFVPLPASTFEERLSRAERAIAAYDVLRGAAQKLPLARPIRNVEVSSDFGPRLDPFLGTLAMHTGIDFKADQGTVIRAAGAGRVLTASYQGGYGNMVEIEHPGGLVTRYAHMSRILVSEGEEILAGEVVGRVGSTGRSTGPHLHYEVRRNGTALDPSRFVIAGDRLAGVLVR
ncbi:peptidoglycan DD-metalloendopeptidase family protein [Microvirga tunisiensis]|uniref:Peptidoglycan DD-metalloendopeptidase family protein n=2 Tax=Pannonibacter tanglangensis TaxID=2750084 RepID=A0ABW9ZC08_9HYPH|nr:MULTISPECIES: M23 family metallopeptidase [unclassified Pannonibacter]NBN62352.1 peptidoglycan DD-metalloendopeptidase family protein [Pannonibacter sp. XCT-34]NBN78019.1 peptidoglycan DD-metalloendopeptidase family protein [Pannonibacter sp. XCT-53]